MSTNAYTHLLTDGLRVRTTEDIECYPIGIFPAGLTGTVCEIDKPDVNGDIFFHVRLDQHFDELDEWDNCLQVYGEETPHIQPQTFEIISA